MFIQTLELLFIASYQNREEKLPTIVRAIRSVDLLKFLVRIAWEIRILNDLKFATVSEKLHEIGRMVGGWKKGLETKTPAK